MSYAILQIFKHPFLVIMLKIWPIQQRSKCISKIWPASNIVETCTWRGTVYWQHSAVYSVCVSVVRSSVWSKLPTTLRFVSIQKWIRNECERTAHRPVRDRFRRYWPNNRRHRQRLNCRKTIFGNQSCKHSENNSSSAIIKVRLAYMAKMIRPFCASVFDS